MSPFPLSEEDLDVPADVADDVDVAEKVHRAHHVRDGHRRCSFRSSRTPRARRPRNTVAPKPALEAFHSRPRLDDPDGAGISSLSLDRVAFDGWYAFRMNLAVVTAQHRLRRGPAVGADDRRAPSPARASPG